MYVYVWVLVIPATWSCTYYLQNKYIYFHSLIYRVFQSMVSRTDSVWSNNKVVELMLSCKYGLVHSPIAASFFYFGLWLHGTSSLSLSKGAPHISCVFVCCCGAAQVNIKGYLKRGGENSCRSVLNGYSCLWKWSCILCISLEDDARWVAVTCPKSGDRCEGYKLLARDHQMTQKLMEDQLGIK